MHPHGRTCRHMQPAVHGTWTSPHGRPCGTCPCAQLARRSDPTRPCCGAATMSRAAAAKYAPLLTEDRSASQSRRRRDSGRLAPGSGSWSPLVARGGTDAQIAAELFIRRPHRLLAPGPDPGQDRLPTPRRPDLAGSGRRPGPARPAVLTCAAGQYGTAQNVPICTPLQINAGGLPTAHNGGSRSH